MCRRRGILPVFKQDTGMKFFADLLKSGVKNGVWALLSLTLTGLFIVGCLYFYAFLGLPNVTQLQTVQLQRPLQIYTRDNKLIAEFGENLRVPVTLDKVPKMLINAVLATEDQRFFEHSGVDMISLLRASKELLMTGKKSQGASTITMQVARNFFLSSEKTYGRKINEILLALKIDSQLSKDKILELYLNKIFLGQRAYGVATAAQIYYGKSLQDLSLGQMAMIAGLPKAPSRDNPISNPAAAKKRRDHVLERMLEVGYIDTPTYKRALAEPVTAHYFGLRMELNAPYVAEMVRTEMLARYGDAAYTQGFKIYTTVDSRLQQTAQEQLTAGLLDYDKRHGYKRVGQSPQAQGALVALNPNDGAVLALVGGFNYYASHFNRATQAWRQPGSGFKPFIYSAALEKGYTLASLINDAPIVIADYSEKGVWRPQNDNYQFLGPTRLRVGLAKSRNLVSIRLLQDIGIDDALDYAKRFGFDIDKQPHTLSLALGTGMVTPIQLASAYASFANGGYRTAPYVIDHIEDIAGKVVYQANPPVVIKDEQPGQPNDAALTTHPAAPRIITAQNAFLMDSVMSDVIRMGTGQRARAMNRNDIAGKTGTTNDQMDAWFTGFNGDIVTTVWVGFDQPQSLFEYGAQAALPIWMKFMKVALQGKPENVLPQPPGIISVSIDPETGLLATPEQDDPISEFFLSDHAPTEYAPAPESDSESDTDSEGNSLLDDEDEAAVKLF